MAEKRTVAKSIRRDFISDNSDSENDDISPQAKARRVSGNDKRTAVQIGKEELKAQKKMEQERKKAERELERQRKLEEKIQKQKEREQRKKLEEKEKQQKRAAIAARKTAKPGECLKAVNVAVSPGVLKSSSGSAILDILQKNDIKYDISPQPHDGIMTVWREVTELNASGELVTSEKVEDNVLLLLPVQTFVNLVDASTTSKSVPDPCVEDLEAYVKKLKESLEDRKITILVQGVEKYFSEQASKAKRAFQAQVSGKADKSRKKQATNEHSVTRLDVETALVHLQLETDCSIQFVDSDQEVAKMVFSFIKAIAEAPFKRERLVSGFSFHMESGGAVSVDREGCGLAAVWRQQIQQFKNVTAEVANTIIAVYPSPISLHKLKAYSRCQSEKEAQLLLQDLEVRRGAGVMATSRRVGKELSKRIHLLLTATDPSLVLI